MYIQSDSKINNFDAKFNHTCTALLVLCIKTRPLDPIADLFIDLLLYLGLQRGDFILQVRHVLLERLVVLRKMTSHSHKHSMHKAANG